jgi:ABC-type transport system involved in cytochrome bd biosynthesis fused ATPase/permease subunit
LVALTPRQLLSQKDIRLKLIRTREELDGNVVELLGGLDYVRVADAHIHEVKRFAHSAEKRRQTELKHHVAMALFGSGKALTEGFFYLLVLASAVVLAVLGHASFGDILVFSDLFLSVMTPMAEVHRILDEGHESALRVGDLLEMLSRPLDPSFHTAMHRTARLDDAAPIIATEGLRVSYWTADGRAVEALHGVSLQVRRGETIGVVGRSGSGKSTLVKVLMRIVHPSGGRVAIKGMPLEEVSRPTISQLIGYVGQSPFLFNGSVEDNIQYGCQAIRLPEDIRRAAQRACIHDEILAMPAGYDTVIAERGANLSGGQKQRIALARIFLKDPPILILDEATSALDNISERIVQQAIEAARADRTVILVAHRPSTLSDADRILVFDGGRLVEEGPYHELVKQGGVFAEPVLSAGGNSSPPEVGGGAGRRGLIASRCASWRARCAILSQPWHSGRQPLACLLQFEKCRIDPEGRTPQGGGPSGWGATVVSAQAGITSGGRRKSWRIPAAPGRGTKTALPRKRLRTLPGRRWTKRNKQHTRSEKRWAVPPRQSGRKPTTLPRRPAPASKTWAKHCAKTHYARASLGALPRRRPVACARQATISNGKASAAWWKTSAR